MKILLINPKDDNYWFRFRPEQESYSLSTHGIAPPLGILYVATVLEERGHKVKVLDNDALRLDDEEILETFENFEPDIVGFSILVGTSENAHRLAGKIDEMSDDVKILYGGPLSTNFPEKIMERYEFVDYLIKGEGEFVTADLVDRLDEGKKIEDLECIAYRDEENTVRVNKGIARVRNLDELPIPNRELFGHEYDASCPLGSYEVNLTIGRFTSLLTSRGCPNKCNFCISEKNEWRTRKPEEVIDELEMLYEKGYRHFFIVDNNFAADEDRVIEICQLIKKRDLDITWHVELSPRNGSYKLFKEMKEAGCEGILLGMESVNDDVLDYYSKESDANLNKRAVDNARKAGISVIAATFMVGAPNEGKDEMNETIEFTKNLDVDAIIISKLSLKPNTTLWNKMKDEGHLSQDLIDEKLEDTIKMHEVYEGHSEEELDKIIENGYTSFLWRPKFLLKQAYRTLRYKFRRNWLAQNWRGILLFIRIRAKEKIFGRN